LVDNYSTSGNEDSDTGSINKNMSSKQLLTKKRAQEHQKAISYSDDDMQATQKSSERIVTTARCTLPTRASREKNHSSKTQNEGISRLIVNSRSAQSTFHAIFTSFQRHEIFKQSVFKQANDAIKTRKIKKIPDQPRRNHIIQRNMEVASWSKQVQAKTFYLLVELQNYDV
jgi:hypothetical protein